MPAHETVATPPWWIDLCAEVESYYAEDVHIPSELLWRELETRLAANAKPVWRCVWGDGAGAIYVEGRDAPESAHSRPLRQLGYWIFAGDLDLQNA